MYIHFVYRNVYSNHVYKMYIHLILLTVYTYKIHKWIYIQRTIMYIQIMYMKCTFILCTGCFSHYEAKMHLHKMSYVMWILYGVRSGDIAEIFAGVGKTWYKEVCDANQIYSLTVTLLQCSLFVIPANIREIVVNNIYKRNDVYRQCFDIDYCFMYFNCTCYKLYVYSEKTN